LPFPQQTDVLGNRTQRPVPETLLGSELTYDLYNHTLLTFKNIYEIQTFRTYALVYNGCLFPNKQMFSAIGRNVPCRTLLGSEMQTSRTGDVAGSETQTFRTGDVAGK
jgi:hypothetical protein